MPDSSTETASVASPLLTPGHLTSEGVLTLRAARLAGAVTWLGATATGITALLEQLQINHITTPWMGPAMVVAGVALKTALAWGYGKQRAGLKADVSHTSMVGESKSALLSAVHAFGESFAKAALANLMKPSDPVPSGPLPPLFDGVDTTLPDPMHKVLVEVARHGGFDLQKLKEGLSKTELKWMLIGDPDFKPPAPPAA